jgi:hypothetical protein
MKYRNLLIVSVVLLSLAGCTAGEVVSAPVKAVGWVGHTVGDTSEAVGDIIEETIDD